MQKRIFSICNIVARTLYTQICTCFVFWQLLKIILFNVCRLFPCFNFFRFSVCHHPDELNVFMDFAGRMSLFQHHWLKLKTEVSAESGGLGCWYLQTRHTTPNQRNKKNSMAIDENMKAIYCICAHCRHFICESWLSKMLTHVVYIVQCSLDIKIYFSSGEHVKCRMKIILNSLHLERP